MVKEISMHVLTAADASRIHCNKMGCRKMARKCIHENGTAGGREYLSFWYLCEQHFDERMEPAPRLQGD